MKKYYIYKQESKLVHDTHWINLTYKYMPFECLGYVEGTKELWAWYQKVWPRPIFCYSWNYYDERFVIRTDNWLYSCQCPHIRYLILDDEGNIRDYYQLTQKHKKKKRYASKKQAYQWHYGHNIPEQRKNITPQEIKEYKEEYRITLVSMKPKRKLEPYDIEYTKRISKGWKQQSKRKRQYKN